MNKFKTGDVVLFNGNLGTVKAIDSWENEFEYAVHFYNYVGMENLFGCSSGGDLFFVPEGEGAWLAEDELEAVE